jgi:hypothetical protein
MRSNVSRGGGRTNKVPPPLTPPHHALRGRAGGEADNYPSRARSTASVEMRDQLATLSRNAA